MADLPQTTRTGNIIDATSARFSLQNAGDFEVGEEMAVGGTPVEFRAGGRNAKVFKCGTSGSGATGVFAGVTPERKRLGQPTTIYGTGTIFHASDSAALLPGKLYYVSDTPGRIADAATTKDAKGAFLAVSATDLQVIRIGSLT